VLLHETCEFMQYRAFLGVGKGFLTNLWLLPENCLKAYGVVFLISTLNDIDAV
jgi:hypothetical protein